MLVKTITYEFVCVCNARTPIGPVTNMKFVKNFLSVSTVNVNDEGIEGFIFIDKISPGIALIFYASIFLPGLKIWNIQDQLIQRMLSFFQGFLLL